MIVGLMVTTGVAAAAAENRRAIAVCKELQGQYAKLTRANENRDLEGILGLRTADFSTLGPNGKRRTYAEMAEYSRQLVSAIRPPIHLENTILTLALDGDMAVVEVLQEFSRRQLINSAERKVETSVIQRERWRRLAAGWRVEFVDDVHDRRWFVDGRRIDPDTPYDPEAPVFTPQDPPRPARSANCGLTGGR